MQIIKKIKGNDEIEIPSRYPHRNQSKRKDNSTMQKFFRNPWTPEEDAQLEKLIDVYSTNWSLIQIEMPHRTGKQIRDRYINVLDKDIKKGKWTIEEDCVVIKSVRKGNKWSEVSRELKGRPENMVKNRFYAVIKKKVPKEVLLQIESGKIKPVEFPDILKTFISYKTEELETNEQNQQLQLTFQEEDKKIPQKIKEEEEAVDVNNSSKLCSFQNFSQFINLGDSQQLFQQAQPNGLQNNQESALQNKGFQLAAKSLNSSQFANSQNILPPPIQQIPINLRQNWTNISQVGQYKIGLVNELSTPTIDELIQIQQKQNEIRKWANPKQLSNFYLNRQNIAQTLEKLNSSQGSIGGSMDFNLGSIAKQGVSMELGLYPIPKEQKQSLLNQLNASLGKSNDQQQKFEESVDSFRVQQQQNKLMNSLSSSNIFTNYMNNYIFGKQKQEEDQEQALQKLSNIVNGTR